MTQEQVDALLAALRETMRAHGVEEAVMVMHQPPISLAWVYPGCPTTCGSPDICAATSLELTAAFLEDRADHLLGRNTSLVRGLNSRNATKH